MLQAERVRIQKTLHHPACVSITLAAVMKLGPSELFLKMPTVLEFFSIMVWLQLRHHVILQKLHPFRMLLSPILILIILAWHHGFVPITELGCMALPSPPNFPR